MWYLGLDVHRRSVTLAGINSEGTPLASRSYPSEDPTALLEAVQRLRPYRAVVEACGSYHWIYERLRHGGEMTLAHPYKLRALWTTRAKTDKLDAIRLAQLLKADLIPAAYVPPPSYQRLRDLVRSRVRMVRDRAEVYHHLHSILARFNWHSPYVQPFCGRGVAWLRTLDMLTPFDLVRRELLDRLTHYDQAIRQLEEQMDTLAADYPQIEALTIHRVRDPTRVQEILRPRPVGLTIDRPFLVAGWEDKPRVRDGGNPSLHWSLRLPSLSPRNQLLATSCELPATGRVAARATLPS